MKKTVKHSTMFFACSVLTVSLIDTGKAGELLQQTQTGPIQTFPVPSQPQQTSATFGDWAVRCVRTEKARHCEVVQSLTIKGQQSPFVQIAFAHRSVNGNEMLALTILFQNNISFDKKPSLAASALSQDLVFRKCVSSGCLADAVIDGPILAEIKEAKIPGKLVFMDAAERPIVVPVSYRGLSQALNQLAIETVTVGPSGLPSQGKKTHI